jgi:hypothetical protein
MLGFAFPTGPVGAPGGHRTRIEERAAFERRRLKSNGDLQARAWMSPTYMGGEQQVVTA